jgi:HK97 family phage major capsid protein
MTTATRPSVPDDVRQAAAKRQHRAARYARDTVDVEARTVELAFASDLPYERWWGTEILDMAPGSVDLSRLNSRHPLLLDHDATKQIGVIERAWIDADRKARALVRFSRGQLGEEIWQDVQDGIRELVSVGYSIDDMVLESRTDDAATYRVTRWTPYEVSIVSVPADPTVGVGRSLAPGAAPAQPKEPPVSETTVAAPAASQPDIRVIENTAASAERQRVLDISAMGRAHQLDDMAGAAVRDGTSVDAFRKAVLDKLVERGTLQPAVAAPEIGLSEREKRQYSVVRLMHALLEPNDKHAQRAAGLEIEASVAARKLQPIDEQGHLGSHRAAGFRVPHDILGGQVAHEATAAADAVRMLARVMAKRDLNVAAPTAGGNLVATDLLVSSFIDLLRNRLQLAGLGATMLDGLVGNIAIPSQTAGAQTYWVAEGTAVTESELTVGQVTMTPKTVGMFTDYTRRTLLQATPSIEALVRADLAAGIAVEIDRAGIAGSGSAGQPRGILNTAGIGAVAGGANGAAPTYANMVALEEAVAVANADVGSMAFLTNARMRAQLRLTQVFSGTNGVPVWASDNTVLGYRTAVSNNVPSNLTKGTASGVCSAILFGNFADLLMGMWSGLDLILDPYALATSGGRRIVALQDVDVAVRRAASFAAMQDALRT